MQGTFYQTRLPIEYEPSPQEIAALTAKIRRKWTPKERAARRALRPRVVSVAELRGLAFIRSLIATGGRQHGSDH